ncbi:MAG TPA: SIS domain-containing protein, partial [Bauldia sp.]|nr:SIS domain-containing protein [Bauldia sp.]
PTLMASEAGEGPAVAARLIAANRAACRDLGARLRARPPAFVVTCARGSSDSAATYAKYVIEIATRTVVASVGPSIASVYGTRPRMKDALFIAISQSGRSPDILALAEEARKDGALTVAFLNETGSPLASLVEVVLPLHAAPERSVAATKSYLASLVGVLQLVSYWTDDPALAAAVTRLPEDLAAAHAADWRPALPLLERSNHLYVAGRGPGFAAALESAIKLKETCGLHAEAQSAAELLHGPMALAAPDFPVLLYSQDDASLPGIADLARVLVRRGVPVLAAGPAAGEGTLALPSATGLHPFAQPIALVQSFYPVAEALARSRGRDPDRPPHLAKVTETR